ncbi:hypothetical protein D4R99_03245 [bacterium]|nr:MAG: hypothetical protein D4R99_03245 [bacterium]
MFVSPPGSGKERWCELRTSDWDRKKEPISNLSWAAEIAGDGWLIVTDLFGCIEFAPKPRV